MRTAWHFLVVVWEFYLYTDTNMLEIKQSAHWDPVVNDVLVFIILNTMVSFNFMWIFLAKMPPRYRWIWPGCIHMKQIFLTEQFIDSFSIIQNFPNVQWSCKIKQIQTHLTEGSVASKTGSNEMFVVWRAYVNVGSYIFLWQIWLYSEEKIFT